MYEYNYKGTGWQPCDVAKAMDILATGYFDAVPVLEHVNEGNVVATTQYEVRRTQTQREKVAA